MHYSQARPRSAEIREISIISRHFLCLSKARMKSNLSAECHRPHHDRLLRTKSWPSISCRRQPALTTSATSYQSRTEQISLTTQHCSPHRFNALCLAASRRDSVLNATSVETLFGPCTMTAHRPCTETLALQPMPPACSQDSIARRSASSSLLASKDQPETPPLPDAMLPQGWRGRGPF